MSVNTWDTNNNLISNSSRFGIGRTLAMLVLLIAPLAVWLSNTGNPVDYFHYDLPPGQALYVVSKLIGLYAVMFLWLQTMYGLLRDDQKLAALLPRWSVSSHRFLGLLVLSSVLLHFGAFFIAASIRKKEIMTHLLEPDFTHGFYTAMVSLGWVALMVMFVVVTAGLLRNRIGKHWLWAHRLSMVVVALVLVHSILIGSEARTVAWLLFYLIAGVTLIIAFIRRMRLRSV